MSEERDKALKSIFKGGAILFVGTILSKFMGLLYRILVGNYLGPEDYGVISVMMAIFSGATTIGFFGLHGGVQKYVSQYRGEGRKEKIKGTIDSAIHLILITSGAVSALLIIFSNDIALFLNEPKAALPIVLVALAIPFTALMRTFANIWEAYENMHYSVYVIKLGSNIIQLALLAALFYLGYGYLGAAGAFAGSFIGAGMLSYYFYRKTLPDSVRKSQPEHNYKELFQHSWPLLAAGMVGIITGHIDTFMIQKMIGTSANGLYNAAYPFGTLLVSFSGIFASIFLSNASKLSGQGKEDISTELYRTVVKWTALIVIPIFLVMFVFPKIPLAVFGSEYTGKQVQNTLKLLASGFMIATLIGPIGSLYQAKDKTHFNLITSIALASVNATANFLLIPVLGIIGAAYGSLLGFIATGAIHLLIFKHITDTHPFRKSTLKIIISGITAISATYFISNTLFRIAPVWSWPLLLCIYGGIYISLIFISGALDEEDLMIIDAIEHKINHDLDTVKKILQKAT